MKKARRIKYRIAAICCGAGSLLSLLVSGFAFMVGLDEGPEIYRLHQQMVKCDEFVQDHIIATGRFPDFEALDNWSNANEMPQFSIATIAANDDDSYGNMEGSLSSPGSKNYRIANWRGEYTEFYCPYDQTFSTSVIAMMASCIVTGGILLGMSIVLYRVRNRFLRLLNDW